MSSLGKGEIEPVHQTTTIADGIAVKRPGELTFSLIRELVDDVVTVTDAEIGQAIVHLLERSKAVVEGAGAVGLAAILAGRVTGRKVVGTLSCARSATAVSVWGWSVSPSAPSTAAARSTARTPYSSALSFVP